MSLETFLLSNKAIDVSRRIRRVPSPAALKQVGKSIQGPSIWIAEPKNVKWLRDASVQTKGDSLLLLGKPLRTQFPLLRERFLRVWLPEDGMVFLPEEELLDVLSADTKDDLFIGGVVNTEERVVLLVRGNLTSIEVPFDDFPPSGTSVPNFAKLAVVEYGTAVAFGEYLATADAILYRHDPKYRKKAKGRRLEKDDTLGGSIRRLRMLRGLSQSDFEPEISAKQIARIESGQTETPHENTMKALAKKLRVKLVDIATY